MLRRYYLSSVFFGAKVMFFFYIINITPLWGGAGGEVGGGVGGEVGGGVKC
jgi:hypothetical protein